MNVEQPVHIEVSSFRPMADCPFHRCDVVRDSSSSAVCGKRFVGGECHALVGGAESFDERRADRFRTKQRSGNCFEVLTDVSCLELHYKRCGLRHSVGGATGERVVPLGNRIGYVRLEPERFPVLPGAVTTPLP